MNIRPETTAQARKRPASGPYDHSGVSPRYHNAIGAVTAEILVYQLPRAGLAQLVEHLICNQEVGGSSPSAGTNDFKGLDAYPFN